MIDELPQNTIVPYSRETSFYKLYAFLFGDTVKIFYVDMLKQTAWERRFFLPEHNRKKLTGPSTRLMSSPVTQFFFQNLKLKNLQNIYKHIPSQFFCRNFADRAQELFTRVINPMSSIPHQSTVFPFLSIRFVCKTSPIRELNVKYLKYRFFFIIIVFIIIIFLRFISAISYIERGENYSKKSCTLFRKKSQKVAENAKFPTAPRRINLPLDISKS